MIVKKPKGYYVVSMKLDKKGKRKKLGGPYKTKKEASARLAQIEYFKHADKSKKKKHEEIGMSNVDRTLMALCEAKVEKRYRITRTNYRTGREYKAEGTLPELIKYYAYTLEKGASWQHEKGNKKINQNPKTIESLVDNIAKSDNNAARNGHGDSSYEYEEITTNENLIEGVTVDLSPWRNSTGKKQPGAQNRGSWIFTVEKDTEMDPKDEGETYFSTKGSTIFSDARKQAIAWAKSKGYDYIYVAS